MFEQEIQQLSYELASVLPVILAKASQILGREVDSQSLNGILGGKGRTHGAVWDRKFSCFEDYFACWLEGMYNDYLSRKDDDEPMSGAGFRNAMLLRDSEIMDFAEKYLKRTFLRKYNERFSGNTPTKEETISWNNKVDALKKQFCRIQRSAASGFTRRRCRDGVERSSEQP